MASRIVLTSDQLWWIGRIAFQRPHDEFVVGPDSDGDCVLRSLETDEAWVVNADGRWTYLNEPPPQKEPASPLHD
jgi:hypothetical protein